MQAKILIARVSISATNLLSKACQNYGCLLVLIFCVRAEATKKIAQDAEDDLETKKLALASAPEGPEKDKLA